MTVLVSRSLRRLSRKYILCLARSLPLITSDWVAEILLVLHGSSGSVSQKQLSGQLEIDESRIVTMIRELTILQLIEVAINPEDRREHMLTLTNKGQQMVVKIREAIDMVNHHLSQGLSTEQLHSFFEVIQRMEGNLNHCGHLKQRK
ncbi:MAG: MarR family winged helix-turn-helix transcriptional regulator [Bacteroidota bacterium]